jgi:hypothetical protein
MLVSPHCHQFQPKKNILKPLRRVTVRRLKQPTVIIHRGPDARVPHHFLETFRVSTRLHHKRRVCGGPAFKKASAIA